MNIDLRLTRTLIWVLEGKRKRKKEKERARRRINDIDYFRRFPRKIIVHSQKKTKCARDWSQHIIGLPDLCLQQLIRLLLKLLFPIQHVSAVRQTSHVSTWLLTTPPRRTVFARSPLSSFLGRRARVGPRYTPTSERKFRYLTTSSDSPEILRERESEKDREIEIKRKRERGRGREKEREESSTRTVVLALLPILRNRLFLRRSLT